MQAIAVIDPKQLQQSAGADATEQPETPLSQEDFMRKIERARDGR